MSSTGSPPDDVNIYFDGYVWDYDYANKAKELSSLRWATATSQLGKDVTLGETPLLIHNAEKKGKISIDGGGFRVSYQTASYDLTDNSKVYVAFTKTGAVNEVNTGTTGSPNWVVNNAIPFEYKEATGSTWTAATGNKFYMAAGGSCPYYNFRFDVEKNDDIYLHVVCEDFRDDQNLFVAVQNDTVCTLEAED